MTFHLTIIWVVNTLEPRQNGRYSPDHIFKWIFFNEIIWISIKISLKSVPRGPINNMPALVQIMAWRRPGDKPLSEPLMIILLTYIWVTRPEWVELQRLPSNQCIHYRDSMLLMPWRYHLMISAHRNPFRIDDPFCGISEGHRRIPLTKGQ